ncbi:hypothetical protein [Porticoccus sp.]
MTEFVYQIGVGLNLLALGAMVMTIGHPMFGKWGKVSAGFYLVTLGATFSLIGGGPSLSIGPVNLVQWGFGMSQMTAVWAIVNFMRAVPGES